MHGHSPGIPHFVNAEADSMEFVDSGSDVVPRTSPCRVAIEKAQADILQEYDVREERRRELEFLEKGGNPLDFKFSNAASLSIQSTSLPEQLADEYILSEAKGSFALAASPHGDSVESSGRPAGSAGRESNTADNLLLFYENSNLDGGNTCTGKRGSAALEESSMRYGGANAKESDDSLMFRLGVKSQAYTRRHRSRPTRDGARVGSSDLFQGISNRSSLVPPSHPNLKEPFGEKRVQKHADSSILNSKAASPNGNAAKKVCNHDQVDLELDAVRKPTLIEDKQPPETKETKVSNNLLVNDHNNQHSQVVAGEIPNDNHSDGKKGAASGTSETAEKVTALSGGDKANRMDIPSRNMFVMHDESLNSKDAVADIAKKPSSRNDTDAETSAVDSGRNIDVIDNDRCFLAKSGNECSNGIVKDQLVEGPRLKFENSSSGEECKMTVADEHANGNDQEKNLNSNKENLGIQLKEEVESFKDRTDKQFEGRSLNNAANLNDDLVSKPKNSINEASTLSQVSAQETTISFNHGPSSCSLSKNGFGTSELQNSASNHSKLAKKAREDAILKEARMIDVNWKRAALLTTSNFSLEKRKKSHWDFVLEEMAWMANDFMQERLWKVHAAAQVCHHIAYGGGLQFKQKSILQSQRNVTLTLCKAIKHFWHLANVSLRSTTKSPGRNANLDYTESMEVDGVKAENDPGSIEEKSRRDVGSVHDYAIRFLKCNIPSETSLAEAPTTPDRLHDAGIVEKSWEDKLSEENLFYNVPSGAMQAYKESMEAQFGLRKKMVNNLQEEDGGASRCDSATDGRHDFAIEEDEGETGTYALPGAFDQGTKFNHKKSKILRQKSFSGIPYNHGKSMSYEPYIESKSGTQPFIYFGKRPSSTLNVGSIPTKRIRSAIRQRVGSLFCAAPSKTDVSSEDTNSFQDGQSSLYGGSEINKNMDVESTMDFERSLQFDLCEISAKSKKKKKPKHLGFNNSFSLADADILAAPGKGSSYEWRLQVDSMIQHEQMDLSKKRLETQQHNSIGNAGIYGQHAAKKLKLSKQQPEALPEAVNQVGGSMSSPVTSQMSNMSNSKKVIKIIANRDRKKSKLAKTGAGYSGCGSSWSLFEDQALVVLVHDLGPNWELVSDAINSTLQFKCIYRKPKECKERHKFLMDKSDGDGVDSAEDSGSSQPYPSTLPGIPKGSARQLFQRLQGPMEEDTLKAHFEKIILLGQQLHSFRRQHHIEELKQVTTPHNSHVVALSEVCSNNLTGGVLTPLDLCDAINPSSEVLSLGLQGSHTSGSAIPCHQGSVTPLLPTPSASAMMNGSSGMVLGTSLPSPSISLGAPTRDVQRYGIPRQSSLPVEEQQRMQQYSQMCSGRNIQQSNIPVSVALTLGVDRGVRMLPATNGIGMMSGMNRGMPMPRPGLQGIGSSMLNMASPGSMLSASGVGMPNPVGPRSPMLRRRAPLQVLPPGQSTEDHGHVMMQEFPVQVSQGNGPPVSSFNCVTATVCPSIQTMSSQPHMLRNPHHSHIQGANHSGPQQQAYAIRYAKECQLQRRMMSQSQHPFSGQTIASHIQNGSQVHPQSQPFSPITSVPSSQSQHKPQPLAPLARAQAGIQNQVTKQRQRPQAQQQQNPQQQQQQQQPPPPQQQLQQEQQQQTAKNNQLQKQQSQQQTKLVKGIGKGVMLNQHVPVDASHMNSLPANKNQVSEKQLMQQGQQFYSGNPVSNPALPQSSNQQRMFPRTGPQQSKQISAIPSHSDASNEGAVQIPPNHLVSSSRQHLISPLPSASQQQHQTNQAQQPMPKTMLPQDRQMSSDGRIPSCSDAQVNPMVASTSISHCTDSVSVAPVAFTAQWKPDPQFDPPTTNSGAKPQDNLLVSEIKHGLVQRQSSGNLPVHGHGSGSGQWQQQPNQRHHRQATQGSLYQRPSNPGPG